MSQQNLEPSGMSEMVKRRYDRFAARDMGKTSVSTQAEEAVRAMNERFGRHDGYRAAHAKGVLCRGTFVATPAAMRLTRALHMQGGEVPVTVRFSNGSGNPHAPDPAPDAR